MFQVPLAGQSIASANVGIDTTITSGNISCTNISATNGTINNLTTTIFNPASITTDTIDTANLNVTNSIPVLNVSVLNVSTKNTSKINVSNMSVSNISATNISATSFTSPDVQPLLIAGDNVSILNNVINVTNDALLPSNANFSSINTSSLNVNNDVIIGGTTYITDLIVSDVINCSTIQANNYPQQKCNLGTNYPMMGLRKL
jgi:trimeric autotransporter adhesin